MKYIPVKPEKWGEMVRALSENTSLKADIDRLRSRYAEVIAENARLKAEVERLTKAGDAMHSFVIGYIVENRLSSSYLSKLDDGWQNAKGVQS
jgi:regulator of replication initiation timing